MCVCVYQAHRLPTVVVFRETRPETENENKDLMILLHITPARCGDGEGGEGGDQDGVGVGAELGWLRAIRP